MIFMWKVVISRNDITQITNYNNILFISEMMLVD